jgi:hypothetical protein
VWKASRGEEQPVWLLWLPLAVSSLLFSYNQVCLNLEPSPPCADSCLDGTPPTRLRHSAHTHRTHSMSTHIRQTELNTKHACKTTSRRGAPEAAGVGVEHGEQQPPARRAGAARRRLPVHGQLAAARPHRLLDAAAQRGQQAPDVLHQQAVQHAGQVADATLEAQRGGGR